MVVDKEGQSNQEGMATLEKKSKGDYLYYLNYKPFLAPFLKVMYARETLVRIPQKTSYHAFTGHKSPL